MASTNQSAKPKPAAPVPETRKQDFWRNLQAASAGVILGLALLKFGNPVIFDELIGRPSGIWELIFQPWPIAWGYCLLAGVALLSLKTIRFTVATPYWIVLLPLIWLGWQGVSALKTIDPNLTRATLLHFGSCVLWFYLGLFVLSQMRHSRVFWLCFLPSFLLALWIGFEQHYGGLEATRQFFYEQPNWRESPPEYLKRMASDRVFSTLVYPNAFAGAILLYLPVALTVTWELGQRLPRVLRCVMAGLVGYFGLACLFWSGSKAGWLIVLLVGIVALLQFQIPQKLKVAFAVVVISVGLIGFAAKFSSYFRKGAASVAARFDYWHAALMTAKQNPIFGTGPGTFSRAYAKLKPPGAEMARLTHNDFLEQASDSGFFGFLTYFVFFAGTMTYLYRQRVLKTGAIPFAIWLGLFAWSVHALVEFPLYIPALAWPVFGLLGWQSGIAGKS